MLYVDCCRFGFYISFGHTLWKLSMEQSFVNENIVTGKNETIEICMIDVILEDKSKENPIMHTKTSKNP